MYPNHTFKEYTKIKDMSVKGGELVGEYKIDVVIAYDGVDRKQLVAWNSEGSSRRVRLQNALRNKTSEETVAHLAETGLVVHARDVDQPMKSDDEKRKEAIAAIRAVFPNATPDTIMEMLKKLQ